MIRVRVMSARGSTPREEGAEMFVGPDRVTGTIGGGQLEYMAIDRARQMLASGQAEALMDIPLGPEIGQCCGGRVLLRLDRHGPTPETHPDALIFGAGHVGRALALALHPLPVNATLIDGRPEELALAAPGIATRLTPLPEAELRAARPGSAVVILTHDHALDFLLAAEALSRPDLSYVGMIGSATKRAQFTRFARAGGIDPAPLICPIGAGFSTDKRPAVIAAFAAAELIARLTIPSSLKNTHATVDPGPRSGLSRRPHDTADNHRYLENGAILVEDGRILAVDDYATLARPNLAEIDHRPHLILPGFIDTHIHFPQVQVIASWGAQLLDWLNTYTFPEEARFNQQGHAPAMAEAFLNLLTAHGTTTAVAFCSVHPESAEALFSAAHARNMAMIAGKVMMDRNAPEAVLDTPQQGYDDSKALIARWHGTGRQRYAITPRFAITSTPEQLAAAGQLAREHPDCHIQTHLSENLDEINFTLSLYPQARDYLDIYETHGLLGDRTLLGHSIHLRPREIARMAETGSRAVFCPTSNLFLGSGLFDEGGLRAAGVVSGIATDVGGGTSYSMLQTLNEGYKILQLRGQKLPPLSAFHWITRGNARVLGMDDDIGTLAPGSMADLVVLDSRATPAMALRMARAETLEQELFILQIMGDDRSIRQTYVAGKPMKTAD